MESDAAILQVFDLEDIEIDKLEDFALAEHNIQKWDGECEESGPDEGTDEESCEEFDKEDNEECEERQRDKCCPLLDSDDTLNLSFLFGCT